MEATDINQVKLPDNITYNLVDSGARTIIADTSEANAMNHLGFYLDANGGLCQVNSI